MAQTSKRKSGQIRRVARQTTKTYKTAKPKPQNHKTVQWRAKPQTTKPTNLKPQNVKQVKYVEWRAKEEGITIDPSLVRRFPLLLTLTEVPLLL